MELFTGTISLASSGIDAAQALVANTTVFALTVPLGVCSRTGLPGWISVTPVFSNISTPASRATMRMPRTSAAGSTVALLRSSTPARWVCEPVRRATSAGDRRSKGVTPKRSQACRVPFQVSM
ncbi:hypothetical protein D3C76_1083830 [compost metagenome]